MSSTASSLERKAFEADSLSDRGDWLGAAKIYESILAEDASHLHALANYAVLCTEMADAASQKGRDVTALRVKAASLYSRALTEKPDWFDGHYNLANLLAEQGPEGESSAILHYREALKVEPNDADAHNNLSVCLLHAGQLETALEHAKTAVRIDRLRPAFLTNLAELYNAVGDIKKAIFFANKSTEPQALLMLASLHQQQGELDEARKALQRLVDTDAKGENLPARLRLYSLLASQPTLRNEAKTLAEKSSVLYAKLYPTDKVGLDALEMLAGKGSGLVSNDDEAELSHAAEMCLLHLKLDDASHLAHKCLVHERLVDAGFTDIAPVTQICGTDKELAAALKDVPVDSLWYIKDPAVQRGQGIRIVKGPVEAGQVVNWVPEGRRVCLQEAITPILLDGRKFGVRMHVFVVQAADGALRVFVSRDGILTKCGKLYAHDDTTRLAQITCTSVQRAEAGFDREAVKGPAVEMWEGFSATLPRIDEIVLCSIKAVASRLCESVEQAEGDSNTAVRAQLFGYDFCFDQDGKPYFIEANISPQFQDAKKLASLRKELAPSLINTVPALLRNDAAEIFEDSHQGWKLIGSIAQQL